LPSKVLDLSGWKITLPIGNAGSPIEVKQPALSTYYHPEYFYVNNENGVVFKAPCGGVTTSGSGYPRSELRERDAIKNVDIYWNAATGSHQMINVLKVTNLPVVKPELCVSQIHDRNDDIIEILVSGNSVKVRGAVMYGYLDENYVLGTVFTVKILVQQGVINVFYNDMVVPKIKIAYTGADNYFKVGAYTQSNVSKGDLPTAYGEVVVYSSEVKHW
jgi:hypothetical protein